MQVTLAVRLGRALAGPRSIVRRPQRGLRLAPRAAQQGGPLDAAAAAAADAAAAAEQQAAAVAQAMADTAAEQEEELEEVAEAVADYTAAAAAAAPAEQRVAYQAMPPPEPPTPSGRRLPIDLNHPAVKAAGGAAAVFLGGTFLLTLWRMSRDPTRKRTKTVNKNKLVVDTIGKFLPGNRAGLSSGSFALLKLQTGFSSVEIFRKYLWFLLRERQYDGEAVEDLVALKAALGLTDEQVAEALRERAQRVYEKYGTVMVNLEGMSRAGIERQAASRNLFIKLLSLLESRQLLGAEAAGTVDLGKIFGVTQRDILTLRSGYSAEAEGAALNEEEEGDDGAAA